MKYKLYRPQIILIIFIAFLANSGCNNSEKKLEKNDSIEIEFAAVLPLSGNLSVLGVPKRRAMEIAAEEFKDSTYKFNFLYQDSKGTPRDGLSALNNLLLNQDINYLYIDLTSIVNVSKPVLKNKNLITFVGSAEPEITQNTNGLFRLFAGGNQELNMIANQLKIDNVDEVFVIHTNEIYGSNAYSYFEEAFTKDGGTILGKEEYPLSVRDTRDILIKAKNSQPDKIILLGYGVAYPTILRQAKELDISNDSFFMNLGATNKAVLDLDAELLNDIQFVGPRFTYLLQRDELLPEMEFFVNKYQEKYDEIPDFRAAYTYDVFKILQMVWSTVSPNQIDSVKARLYQVKDFAGSSGNISILSNGDSETDLVVAKFRGNKIILAEENNGK